MIEIRIDLTAAHPAVLVGALAVLLAVALLRQVLPPVRPALRAVAWVFVGRWAARLRARWESEDAGGAGAAGA